MSHLHPDGCESLPESRYVCRIDRDWECSICFHEANRRHRAINLRCGHAFHVRCLVNLKKAECPLCRASRRVFPRWIVRRIRDNLPRVVFEEACETSRGLFMIKIISDKGRRSGTIALQQLDVDGDDSDEYVFTFEYDAPPGLKSRRRMFSLIETVVARLPEHDASTNGSESEG